MFLTRGRSTFGDSWRWRFVSNSIKYRSLELTANTHNIYQNIDPSLFLFRLETCNINHPALCPWLIAHHSRNRFLLGYDQLLNCWIMDHSILLLGSRRWTEVWSCWIRSGCWIPWLVSSKSKKASIHNLWSTWSKTSIQSRFCRKAKWSEGFSRLCYWTTFGRMPAKEQYGVLNGQPHEIHALKRILDWVLWIDLPGICRIAL